MKKPPAKKRGGARKGNKNARKHGIYSRFISIIDDDQLAEMAADTPKDELAIARTRLVEALDRQEHAADDETYLKYDIATRHWTEIISGIIARTKEKAEQEIMVFETILDAINYWNDIQSIKK